MKPFVLAIAGGTGSGKSTLAEGLAQTYPGNTLNLHLDDYFKRPPELPKLGKYLNWDHPNAVYSHQLQEDLMNLKQGKSSEITQRDSQGIREFDVWGPRKRVSVEPKRLIILEGFLALYFPKLREAYDYSVYLDAPFETHISRRVHGMPDSYHVDVIRPMHDEYVTPTSQFADTVLDVSKLGAGAILERVVQLLPTEVTTA